MKNIHLIPTDKPSRLCLDRREDLIFYPRAGFSIADGKQHIYITNDKVIKEGDWCLDINKNIIILWSHPHTTTTPFFKKIILTTDPDLIKDGVQAIDEEFLQWFVKNPSCEKVELEATTFPNEEGIPHCYDGYKIIIPKEELKQDRTCNNNCSDVCGECQIFEPKQETTLEEAAERYSEELLEAKTIQPHEKTWIKAMFIWVAKWQAERMYSEEDLQEAFYAHNQSWIDYEEWLKHLKKK